MRMKWLALGLLIVSASAAQASTVAGWDFSQYRGDGLLSIDGATFTNTLPANYSSLDPTGNAGSEAAMLGTLHMDGTAGSSAVSAGENAEVVPTAGSLKSNLAGAANGPGTNSFDALTLLRAEGQRFQQRLSLTASSSANLVFEADFSNSPGPSGNFGVTFAGRTLAGTGENGGQLSCDAAGCSSTIGVEFSPDGSTWSSFGSVQLTPIDRRYEVALGPNTVNRGFVRLSLDPSGGQPVIDNVAITVPEPAGFASAAAAALTLLGLGRRRR